MRTLQH